MHRKLISIFLILFILVLSCSIVKAQTTPTVTSVTTNGYRGSTIIIRGTNFTANGDNIPRIYFGSGASWTELDENWRDFSPEGTRWYWDNSQSLIFRIPHYISTGAQAIKICAGYDRDDPLCGGSCCVDEAITIKADESGESFGSYLRTDGYGTDEGHAENILYQWYRLGMEEAGDTYLSYNGHIFFPVYRPTEKAVAVLVYDGNNWAKYLVAKPVEWATGLSVSLAGSTVRLNYTDEIGSRTKDIYTAAGGVSFTQSGSNLSSDAYILPLGDSITAGAGDNGSPTIGYRRALQSTLGVGTYNVVGSQVSNPVYAYRTYDYNSAGVSGDTTLDIMDRFLSREIYNIKEDTNITNQYLLVHAGTNDITVCCCSNTPCSQFGDSCDVYQDVDTDPQCDQVVEFAINNIRTIVEAAHDANSNIKVILSKIIPFAPSASLSGSSGVLYNMWNPALIRYNQSLVDLYHELRYDGYNVFLVNNFTGFHPWEYSGLVTDGYYSDSTHPIGQGYDVIGGKFATGITNFNTNNENIDDCDLQEVYCLDNFEQEDSSEGTVTQAGTWSFWGQCTNGCMDASHGIFSWYKSQSARLAGTEATTALGDQNTYHKFTFDTLTGTTDGALYIRWGTTQAPLLSATNGYLRVAVDEDGDAVADKTWQGATALLQTSNAHTWVELESDAVDGRWDFEPDASVTVTSDRNEGIFKAVNIDAVMFDSRTYCDDDGDCDDSLYCNGEETCNLSTNTCTIGTDPCPEDDGLFCNGVTTGCDETADACIHSGNPCTPDLCDEDTDSCYSTGVCTTNEDCDDDLYCNGEEYCSGGDCYSGTPIDCDDADDCTTDTCNETTDSCDHPIDKDTDEDGYVDDQCSGGDDCDDSDPTVSPGQYEGPFGQPICSDTIDNDCDTLVDEDDPGCVGIGGATRVIIINTQ